MSGAEIIPDSLVPIIAPSPPVEPPAFNPAEIAAARRYADASRAASTQRAYMSDWRRFSAWCADRGLETCRRIRARLLFFFRPKWNPDRRRSR
jgi:hypothetical protein